MDGTCQTVRQSRRMVFVVSTSVVEEWQSQGCLQAGVMVLPWQ